MVAASPAKGVPRPRHPDALLERLRKVLAHEQRTGCADRATVGGLERFVRQLALQAPPGSRELAWLEAVQRHLHGYAGRSASERERLVEPLLARLTARGVQEEGAAPPAPARQAPVRGEVAAPPVEAAKGPGSGMAGVRPMAPRRETGLVTSAEAPPQRVRPRRPASPAILEGKVGRRAVPALPVAAPIGELPGVGPKAVAALARLEVHSIRDLLYHLPRRHLDRRSVTAIADLRPGGEVTVFGTVRQAQVKRSPVQGLTITDAIIQDETGFCHAVWFNQPYLARSLSRPGKLVLSGRVEYGQDGGLQLVTPEFEFDSQDLLHTGRLVPFYPKTEGLYDKQLRTWVRTALAATAGQLRDAVPGDVLRDASLPDLATALTQAHFPDDDAQLGAALRRLAFDEFLLIQLGILRRRREWRETEPGLPMAVTPEELEVYFAGLPFSPTEAQRRVVAEIAADMAQPVPMSRLLQGEVGSGKTVAAAAACFVAVRCGYQAAVMAPTEVLAQQHHRTLSQLLAPFGLRVELVTGSLRRKEKAQVWQACAAGEVDVLVGTHALIQEDATFKNLGLAVVDEQHRFGVRQRGALRRKGAHPDLLVMTATPIPRTLALSIYGDLDISFLDQLPPGRQQIKTFAVSPQHRHRAYDFLRKQVRAGRQGFIICPLIEESDKIEARAAKAEYERLQRQFPDLRLALLHGRLAPKEKEAVMVSFRDGLVDVLVSTAVVEVGIDVPNATVMLIEGADRFGLSQLHQFRGRVGRGEHQSYCLLLSDSADAEVNPRLQAVVENHEGLALAEEDLKLRGPGEFFGTRQSGLPDLKVAKLSDVDVLELARRQAQRIDARDPDLARPEHAALRQQVEAFWRAAEGGA
ncbi:MAG TPA: ATP-dependent DNA helicase RecG [Chloroflexota bacterium]|nr:ATP-dependent DNA helicase RecG [Chloroflexota bacterium]